MAWIQRLGSQPDNCPPAAVAVAEPHGTHTGIVYMDDEGGVRFIHLAFHYRLQRDALCADTETGWVLPAETVPQERLEHVAAMCERIWERHQQCGLPYGFRYNATRFHQDGTLEIGADECGLTCATFVLAIYRSVGLELLELAGWPARDDDAQRFRSLLDQLQRYCKDPKHIQAVSKEVNSIRYRPLEVAGGSRYTPPARFEDAAVGAAAIESELSQAR